MELTTGLLIVAGLFLLVLVPYLVLEIRKGKAFGHSDIGKDASVHYPQPGEKEGSGPRR